MGHEAAQGSSPGTLRIPLHLLIPSPNKALEAGDENCLIKQERILFKAPMATGNSTCLLNTVPTEMYTLTEHWCRKDASQHLQKPLLEFVWCWRAALLERTGPQPDNCKLRPKVVSWWSWGSRFVHYVSWSSTSVYSYTSFPFSLWTWSAWFYCAPKLRTVFHSMGSLFGPRWQAHAKDGQKEHLED